MLPLSTLKGEECFPLVSNGSKLEPKTFFCGILTDVSGL